MKKHLVWTAALVAVAACGSSSETAPTTVAPTTTATATTSTTSTTVASTTTLSSSGVPSTLSWEVTGEEGSRAFVTFTDTSGRNKGVAPTLQPRTWQITINRALDDSGLPMALRMEGVYTNSGVPQCNRDSAPDRVLVCVGFPLMDNDRVVDFRDIGNHPADVSLTLDALLADPTLAGPIDPNKIWYSGASMGGISGLSLLTNGNLDNRFAAIVSYVGFAPFWDAQFQNPAAWSDIPKILLVNSMTDQTIPYDLARATMKEAGDPSKITLVTIFDAPHGNLSCRAADTFTEAWVSHHVFGEAAPDEEAMRGSDCGTLGLVDGPRTGWGQAGPFVPPGYEL